MTTGWGASLHAHELAHKYAIGDREAQGMLWNRRGGADRAYLMIAMAAQARLAADRSLRDSDGQGPSAPDFRKR
jgi:hypothetical protein